VQVDEDERVFELLDQVAIDSPCAGRWRSTGCRQLHVGWRTGTPLGERFDAGVVSAASNTDEKEPVGD